MFSIASFKVLQSTKRAAVMGSKCIIIFAISVNICSSFNAFFITVDFVGS